MASGVLVAGVGNLFLGDDGFGPEVVRRLTGLPPHARVVDYGIRGLHLAYDLLDGYDALVLVDAVPGAPPGHVDVLRVDQLGGGDLDPHGMDPAAVLATVRRLGGTLPPTYVVGCRVASVADGMGLSPPVAEAVDEAVRAVRALVDRLDVAAPANGRN
jgi:hydrogenase maturation protease